MSYSVFGIRHHGPGSARSLCQGLADLAPDMLLIEGPPEADHLLTFANHPAMQPPVALLVYAPDEPADAWYYPFAVFSPEWQAIQYGLTQNVPVRFMDLPVAHRIAMRRNEAQALPQTETSESEADVAKDELLEVHEKENNSWRYDPLIFLAKAAGYDDSERWWEHMVEERRDSQSLFDAITEAMTQVRRHIEQNINQPASLLEQQREAYMRKTIRTAEKQGYQRIAVVCGAWHVPALYDMPTRSADNQWLKGLPKVKTNATWVPWTYGRLSIASGYGAGIKAPGWYHHLWDHPNNISIQWLTHVAHALRTTGLDVSSAHIIEAVRLAEALAAMRDRPLPALPEFNDATQSVMLFGETTAMQLIQESLVVGERLGGVPNEVPITPLQQDLQQQQKRLRLKPSASIKALVLDLRKPMDLQRSCLFYRLNLLEIPWGQVDDRIRSKGTFKESWHIKWLPDFEVTLIESGRWGNTIEQAASAAVIQQTGQCEDLAALAQLTDYVLLADLTQAIDVVMQRLQAQAAVASDIVSLMQAVPSLARLLRYGDVRQTSLESVKCMLDGMLSRICIGLVYACSALNEEAAEAMFHHIQAVHDAIKIIEPSVSVEAWQRSLLQIIDADNLQYIIKGRCCRLLLDSGVLSDEHAARQLSVALSIANPASQAAAWLDGFLRGSGQWLIHDETLWQLIDRWLCQLTDDNFTQILPLLRRTFVSFEMPERRQMAERVKRAEKTVVAPVSELNFDQSRAETSLPLLATLLALARP